MIKEAITFKCGLCGDFISNDTDYEEVDDIVHCRKCFNDPDQHNGPKEYPVKNFNDFFSILAREGDGARIRVKQLSNEPGSLSTETIVDEYEFVSSKCTFHRLTRDRDDGLMYRELNHIVKLIPAVVFLEKPHKKELVVYGSLLKKESGDLKTEFIEELGLSQVYIKEPSEYIKKNARKFKIIIEEIM